VAVASAVLLAGCSGGGSGSTPATSSPSASAPAASSAAAGAAGGLAGQDARAILDRSRAAFTAAQSVHLKGRITQGSQTTGVDLRIKGSQGATGTIAMSAGTLKVVRIGRVAYVSGDRKFWTNTLNAAAAQQLSGKWVKTSPDTPGFSQFIRFTQLEGGWDQMLKPSSTMTKGAETEVNGTPAIELKEGGPSGGSLFIATRGEPYPLRVSGAGGSTSGRLDFTEYGEPVTLAAPPAGQVITAPGS
jgi:hypothetical protein